MKEEKGGGEGLYLDECEESQEIDLLSRLCGHWSEAKLSYHLARLLRQAVSHSSFMHWHHAPCEMEVKKRESGSKSKNKNQDEESNEIA